MRRELSSDSKVIGGVLTGWSAGRYAVAGLTPTIERQGGSVTRNRFIAVLLGSLALFGHWSQPVSAQATAEEACAAALSLRYPGHVERAIQLFPQDPCIAVMLSALPARVLSQLSPEIVATLPRSQLQRVSPEALAALGITLAAPTSRSVGTSSRPRPSSSPY